MLLRHHFPKIERSPARRTKTRELSTRAYDDVLRLSLRDEDISVFFLEPSDPGFDIIRRKVVGCFDEGGV